MTKAWLIIFKLAEGHNTVAVISAIKFYSFPHWAEKDLTRMQCHLRVKLQKSILELTS